MSKKLAIITACLLAGIAPALAQNATCIEPVMPAAVDGNSATQAQLVTTRDQVRDFIAKSDIYQTCISEDLEAKKKAAAAANQTFDNQLQQVALAKIAANQAAKDLAAKGINDQIAIFRQKNTK